MCNVGQVHRNPPQLLCIVCGVCIVWDVCTGVVWQRLIIVDVIYHVVNVCSYKPSSAASVNESDADDSPVTQQTNNNRYMCRQHHFLHSSVLLACLFIGIFNFAWSSFYWFWQVVRYQSALSSICSHLIWLPQLHCCSSLNLELSPSSSSNVYLCWYFLAFRHHFRTHYFQLASQSP